MLANGENADLKITKATTSKKWSDDLRHDHIHYSESKFWGLLVSFVKVHSLSFDKSIQTIKDTDRLSLNSDR